MAPAALACVFVQYIFTIEGYPATWALIWSINILNYNVERTFI